MRHPLLTPAERVEMRENTKKLVELLRAQGFSERQIERITAPFMNLLAAEDKHDGEQD